MLEFALGIVIGAIVGWKVSEWMHMGTLLMMLKEFKITDDQIRKVLEKEGVILDSESTTLEPTPKKTVIDIKVEKHGEQFYAFEVNEDRFLGQGPTVEALAQQILNKVPKGIEIQCDVKNGGEYFTLEAK
jgi:hypothetical protein